MLVMLLYLHLVWRALPKLGCQHCHRAFHCDSSTCPSWGERIGEWLQQSIFWETSCCSWKGGDWIEPVATWKTTCLVEANCPSQYFCCAQIAFWRWYGYDDGLIGMLQRCLVAMSRIDSARASSVSNSVSFGFRVSWILTFANWAAWGSLQCKTWDTISEGALHRGHLEWSYHL